MKEKKSFLFKLGLIGLAVASVFIACFSNADLVLDGPFTYFTIANRGTETINTTTGQVYCIITSTREANITITYENNNYTLYQNLLCFDGGPDIYLYSNYNGPNTVYVRDTNISENLFKRMSSLECQTEYNLIPISSVDQSYCESNNLCPSGGSSDCPNVGVSNLFINDIFHPGAFNVVINIPEEIDRDYAYTNSGYNFNLDIVGYNVDYTKVQDQIDIQSYKPNTEDLNSIISGVIPLFIPGLIIILFLYFIFRFIKKIF